MRYEEDLIFLCFGRNDDGNALRIIRSDHILIMIIHNDVQLLGSVADRLSAKRAQEAGLMADYL